MNLDNKDELIDIVDQHDNIVSTMWRSEASAQKIQYRRIVLAFLVDPEGNFCLLRRSAYKTYPLHLALVGGGVKSGESYEQAFKREVKEEANLDVNKYSYKELGYVKPVEGEDHLFFQKIYEIKVSDQKIGYNPEDFCEYRWITAQEFHKNIIHNDKIASDLPYLINRFYGTPSLNK